MTRWQVRWGYLLLVLRGGASNRRVWTSCVVWFALATLFFYATGLTAELGFGNIERVLGWFLAFCLITAVVLQTKLRSEHALNRLSGLPGANLESGRDHSRRILGELLRTAALVDRAGVEALALSGKLPPAQRGASRRRTLDLARAPGRWETYSAAEQGLLLSDEGSWSWPQVQHSLIKAEDIRVMRWVLGMDAVLAPFELLRPDVSHVLRCTTRPGSCTARGCQEVFDLQAAQVLSWQAVIRCADEGVSRGIFQEENLAVRAEQVRRAERAASDERDDPFAGKSGLSKASEEKLRWIGQTAFRRYRVLTDIIGYLNGPADAKLMIAG